MAKITEMITPPQTQKPPTAVQVHAVRADFLKHTVSDLLGWTEFEYCEYQYQMGIAYLMWYLPCDERSRRKLERSRMYWNWYKNQWAIYDESLLTYKLSLNQCPIPHMREVYRDLHCPHKMAVEVKPNDVVLNSIKTIAL